MSAGYVAAGGVVPARQVHPEVPGGECVGHGGVALKLWVGLNRDQDLHLERMGQVECPQGRQGQWYFPLKTRAEAAVQSALDGHDGMAGRDVILRPISVTHVGLLRMLQSGHLYPVDADQWRLYAPLRVPAPRDDQGHPYYAVHGPTTVA